MGVGLITGKTLAAMLYLGFPAPYPGTCASKPAPAEILRICFDLSGFYPEFPVKGGGHCPTL